MCRVCIASANFIITCTHLNVVKMKLASCVLYLEEVTGSDEEGRVLLLVFRTLLSQRRQSLQTQLADL